VLLWCAYFAFIQLEKMDIPATGLSRKRYLVTGSAGHLGEALVRHLQNLNVEVISIDILSSPFTSNVGSIFDSIFVETCMRGVDVVLHAATLHKPHVATHSRQNFVDTNITGTLTLLEAAVSAGVKAFVYTSTTSVYGDSLEPKLLSDPAVWITEDSVPSCKNIYGVTKLAAEDMCQLFHRNHTGISCMVLRTSRFFPEGDDVPSAYADDNEKANEYLFRRAEIGDIVCAHMLAAESLLTRDKGKFCKYIISATTPFSREDTQELRYDAPAVVQRYFPRFQEIYDRAKWTMYPGIGRVYDNCRARAELGWTPKFDFQHILSMIENQCQNSAESVAVSVRSPLAVVIGEKLYHRTVVAGAEPDSVD